MFTGSYRVLASWFTVLLLPSSKNIFFEAGSKEKG